MTFGRNQNPIYDWNPAARRPAPKVTLLDETLRDGLQSPSVRHPALEEKAELLKLMDGLGIGVAKIGMPSVSERVREDCVALARCSERAGLGLGLACSARALPRDVEDVAFVSQKAGRPIEAYVFIATSALRGRAEGWGDETVRDLLRAAFEVARREQLPFAFVAEDATRTEPDILRGLIRFALDEGASRLCLCDTTGSATPSGASAIVAFAKAEIERAGHQVGLDWHGHDDRGLSLGSALAAREAGAERLHATALGVGERAGNVAMEALILNLAIDGLTRGRPERLGQYCRAAAHALRIEVPSNHPVIGRDVFRTAAGTHAAAIAKAEDQGDPWVTDRIYSAFPASWVGQKHTIEIGTLSGRRAVVHWLERQGIEPDTALVASILAEAKASDSVLSDADLWRAVREHKGSRMRTSPDPRR